MPSIDTPSTVRVVGSSVEDSEGNFLVTAHTPCEGCRDLLKIKRRLVVNSAVVLKETMVQLGKISDAFPETKEITEAAYQAIMRANGFTPGKAGQDVP